MEDKYDNSLMCTNITEGNDFQYCDVIGADQNCRTCIADTPTEKYALVMSQVINAKQLSIKARCVKAVIPQCENYLKTVTKAETTELLTSWPQCKTCSSTQFFVLDNNDCIIKNCTYRSRTTCTLCKVGFVHTVDQKKCIPRDAEVKDCILYNNVGDKC